MLTPAQRREWLGVRIDELRGWLHRAWVDARATGRSTARRCALGSAWPDRAGVRRLAHPDVSPPAAWPAAERRLQLDLGGEGLVAAALRRRRRGGVRARLRAQGVPARAASRSRSSRDRRAARRSGCPTATPRLALARVGARRRAARAPRAAARAGARGGARRSTATTRRRRSCEAAARALRRLELAERDAPTTSRARPTRRCCATSGSCPTGSTRAPPGLDDARARVGRRGRASVLDGELAAARASATRPAGALLLTGHAHLDLAWRWPLAETRRKARRTLWTQVGLLERHPELHFNQSTAQVYAFLEEDDPELLARLERARRRAAASSRSAACGSSPTATCRPASRSCASCSTGSAAFRAPLRRRRTRSAGCPTASASRPRCRSCCAAPASSTSSRSSSPGRRPTASRTTCSGGRGSTASRVLAHMFDNPDGGYNGRVGPRAALATWRNYRGRDVAPGEPARRSATATAAAGRPRRWSSARARWTASPPCPRSASGASTSSSSAREAAWPSAALPVWAGELYLELHRGDAHDAGADEARCTGAPSATSSPPRRSARLVRAGRRRRAAPSLEALWRVLLRNEFHDILPGSSIREVYEDAERELGEVIAAARASVIAARLAELASARLGAGERRGRARRQPRPVGAAAARRAARRCRARSRSRAAAC